MNSLHVQTGITGFSVQIVNHYSIWYFSSSCPLTMLPIWFWPIPITWAWACLTIKGPVLIFKSLPLWHQICAPPPFSCPLLALTTPNSHSLSEWANMYRPICSTAAYGWAGGRNRGCSKVYHYLSHLTASLIWSWTPTVWIGRGVTEVCLVRWRSRLVSVVLVGRFSWWFPNFI